VRKQQPLPGCYSSPNGVDEGEFSVHNKLYYQLAGVCILGWCWDLSFDSKETSVRSLSQIVDSELPMLVQCTKHAHKKRTHNMSHCLEA